MKKLRRLAFGIVAAALILEVGARVWLRFFAERGDVFTYALYTDIPSNERQWSPHPYLGYIPTPYFHRGKLSHNSLGFRGPEIPVAKPAGVFRIAILGGSTVYGVSIDDNAATFPGQVERALREQYGRQNVQVINAAAGAYTSWESLVDLEFRVIDLSPDLVIIYHGVNDVHSRMVKRYQSDNVGRRTVWTPPPVRWWEHSVMLRILMRRAGLSRQVGLEDFVDPGHYGFAGSVKQLRRNPPIYFERNLRSMVALARAYGASVMLSTWAHTPQRGDYAATPAYEQGFAENNEVVKKLGAELQVPTLDFAAEMPPDKRYWSDGRHVNADGARLQGEAFARFLIEQRLVP